MSSLLSQLQPAFKAQFGGKPRWLASAPGRVNLIGDHTDYNQGFVLPMAIERHVAVLLRPRQDKRVVLRALNYAETEQFDINNLSHGKGWTEYANSVLWSLTQAGLDLEGFDGIVASDLPIGSGLSSSAAFELALARACYAAAGADWKPSRAAQLMQKAENDWVGVASGIMDPLISAIAEPGRAALIDCRDLHVRQVAIPRSASVVVMNTMKRRGLVDSAYNERRSQCEQAAKALGVGSLRDVSLAELEAKKTQMDELVFKRARHVLSENNRVLDFGSKLEANDLADAGERMNASHASLRDDYEVSCAELDAIVAAAQAQAGCFGARMTGAGFGGCAVALVQRGTEAEFESVVMQAYQSEFNVRPEMIISAPAAGAQLVELP
jgi:galactokinase